MTGYKSTIAFANKELSAKEKVKLKDTTNAVQLTDAVENGSLVLDLDFYVILHIENDKAEDKEYDQIVLVDKGGCKFVTGSKTFMSTLAVIDDEMSNTNEDYQIEVYTVESKNHKGKSFLTCSIV